VLFEPASLEASKQALYKGKRVVISSGLRKKCGQEILAKMCGTISAKQLAKLRIFLFWEEYYFLA
jgi:hypothetical protein